ncbi:MAG TPA: MarR family transcriptional regulator [Polyangiaceae bacterium]|nr:MAG: MarR family protein [Deltaproteobacteria bacterium ADurb.Bin207]HNS95484.1 MarR family transcriptional regulator [Polyangiaceae bacterium]HNZ20576.1 MarR family transcriptional regulator [Polyangiaceae bacterium]HOD20808.1 MarR family transcriptional regulator [Polyangiaceae bacterium]HOE47228.1 MarR family transcriptional regulator [Polyangiaceae bacterium]
MPLNDRDLATEQQIPQSEDNDDRLSSAVHAVLEGVGAEISASFPGITRLGGQIVAVLYLADGPRSMDTLAEELGRSKSNIFTNLKALEGAGIVERRRVAGLRHDTYALTGPYPDVIIGAYLGRLRRVVADKRKLTQRALMLLGDAPGPQADSLRRRLLDLQRKYELFGRMFSLFGTAIDGPVDLEALLSSIPGKTLEMFVDMARMTLGKLSRSGESGGEGKEE